MSIGEHTLRFGYSRAYLRHADLIARLLLELNAYVSIREHTSAGRSIGREAAEDWTALLIRCIVILNSCRKLGNVSVLNREHETRDRARRS